MNRFLNAPAPRGRVASGAPRCAPLEPTPLPNRLRHVRARDPRPRLHTPRNAPRLKDCRTPPGPPPQSQPMFVAERKGGDFVNSSLARTHAQSRAQLESPRTRVPFLAKRDLFRASVPRPAALQSKRIRSRDAYGAQELAAHRLAHRRSPPVIPLLS